MVDEEEKHWWGLSTGINDDKTINSQRYQQAYWIWERKRAVFIPSPQLLGSGASELCLVDEEGKHWWGLSAGTNDDRTINSRRYEQAWFGRGERI